MFGHATTGFRATFKGDADSKIDRPCVNFDKVSWRPSVEEKGLLQELCWKYDCDSQTTLMHFIMTDLRRSEIAGIGDPEQRAQSRRQHTRAPSEGRSSPQAWTPTPRGTEAANAMPSHWPAYLEQQAQILALQQSLSFVAQRNAALEKANRYLQQQNQLLLGQIEALHFSLDSERQTTTKAFDPFKNFREAYENAKNDMNNIFNFNNTLRQISQGRQYGSS